MTGADERESGHDTFEQWAQVSVWLFGHDPAETSTMLRELAVGSSWEVTDEHWTKTLATEMLRGNLEHLEPYAELLAQELERRRVQQRGGA